VAKSNPPARQERPAPPQEQPPAPQHQPAVKRTLRETLELHIDRITDVLPKHLTPDRMIALVSNIVYRTPKLQQCDPMSIISSVQQASALGLDLSPTTGEAYLVPVWNQKLNKGQGALECQFRPGYRGLSKLVKQSGAVVDIVSDLVFERDQFYYRRVPQLEFLHEPYLGPGPRGEVTGVYALVELPTGKYEVEYMNAEDVEKIHVRSEGYKSAVNQRKQESGPWVTDRGEMARKTVVRRMTKRFPMSPELAEAVAAMDRDYNFDAPSESADDPRGGPRVARTRGLAGLRDQLGLDAPALPPGPTKTYTEADEDDFDPGPDDDGTETPSTEEQHAPATERAPGKGDAYEEPAK
jgi:recombination protein RecT